MNKELLENQWGQIKGLLREKWNHLTDEDLNQINGRLEPLINRLQQRYGYTKEQAEEEVRRFTIDRPSRRAHNTDRSHFFGPEKPEQPSSTESYSWLKPFLLVGLPLFLLGYFLSSHWVATSHTRSLSSPSEVREITLLGEGPVDIITSRNIYSTLVSQNLKPADLSQVRISTSNGVVTLSGSVSNAQQRALIETTTRNTPGVIKVVNEITVK